MDLGTKISLYLWAWAGKAVSRLHALARIQFQIPRLCIHLPWSSNHWDYV